VTTERSARRVGVLYGGLSSEREVSLESGEGVVRALRGLGHEVAAIDWAPGTSLPALLEAARPDVVWIALHGTYGEDGAVQGLLACLGIPYTGSGVLASALAMDKVVSKRIFESNGVPTPAWRLLAADDDPARALEVGLPLVVKPALEGSSVGVTIVRGEEALAAAVGLARRHRGPTMVEAFVPGFEINTAILGEEILGSVDIRPAVEFYDYAAKYLRDDTRYLVPPPDLAPDVVARVEAVALAAHRALGCTAYSRVDLRVTPEGEPSVLEVNTLPGMTSHSLLPKIAAHRGIAYAALCERILDMSRVGA
jgi:D-alanine-D-alanine ligase